MSLSVKDFLNMTEDEKIYYIDSQLETRKETEHV